jgi:ABC-type sugar transport system ATPase subunit
MTVFENLAYPLRVRKMAEAAMKARIQSVAETLQIERFLERLPSQLSGGQMQRVAIGRALVREADVFLLDEPISHLDAQLRARMRVEFKRLQRDFKATMLYVSHDQLEAMTMADRIVLINKGRIEQISPPQEMFDRPATLFAATFIGEPAMNTIPARLVQHGGAVTLTIGHTAIAMGQDWAGLNPAVEYIAGFRPQHLGLAAPDSAPGGRVDGTVFAVETLGSRVVYDIDLGGSVVRVMTSVDAARGYPRQIGAAISFRVDPDFVYLFDASSGETVRQARFALKAQ